MSLIMKVWKEVRTIEQVIIFIKQQPYIDTKQNEMFSGLSQWKWCEISTGIHGCQLKGSESLNRYDYHWLDQWLNSLLWLVFWDTP